MSRDSIVVGLDLQNDDLLSDIATIVASQPGIRLKTSEDVGYPDLLIM